MFRRPIFPIAFYLSFGAIFLRFAPSSRMIAVVCFLVAALISSRFLWRRKDRSLYLFLTILAFAVMFLRHQPPLPPSSQGQLISVVSRARAHGRYRLSFRGRLKNSPKHHQQLVTVVIDGPRQFFIRPGMTLRIKATTRQLGVSLVILRARWSHCQIDRELSPGKGQQQWQRWLGQSLESLPPPTQGLLKSALLGQKTELDPSTKRLFRRVGTAHLLAVSGLHVTLIAGVIFAAFRLTGARLRVQLIGALIATWLYVALVGFRPATFRAALLLSCFLLARCFGLRRDPWNLLAFAACLLLIHRADALFDVGAQLSFASFSGLVFASSQVTADGPSPTSLTEKWITIMGKSWVFTAWAFLSSTPFVLYHFGVVEPTALLSNLPAVPLFSAFLAVGLIGTLLSTIHPFLGAPTLKLASLLASLLLTTLRFFDGLLPSISLAHFHPTMIFVPPVIALASYFYWKRQKVLCATACLIALMTLIASIPRPERQVLQWAGDKGNAVKSTTQRTHGISLRFDQRTHSVLVGPQSRPLRLNQTKLGRGRWHLGALLISKFSEGVWAFQRGPHTVLWIRGPKGFDEALRRGDIQPSTGLIVSSWLPKATVKRLSKRWKGDWVVFQGIFEFKLDTQQVIQEQRFELLFGETLVVRGLKK